MSQDRERSPKGHRACLTVTAISLHRDACTLAGSTRRYRCVEPPSRRKRDELLDGDDIVPPVSTVSSLLNGSGVWVKFHLFGLFTYKSAAKALTQGAALSSRAFFSL